MNPLPVSTGAAVDAERERLLSILNVVFENEHYSSSCGCEHCSQTRKLLSEEDLDFVNGVARLVNSNGHRA